MIEGDNGADVMVLEKASTVSADLYRDALQSGRSLRFDDATYTRCEIAGTDMIFVTDMERDPIQRAHRRGRFFEPEELELIRQVFPEGGTFVDIGSNVGNHSLYVGKYLKPKRIIPFEPNPLAYRLLFANIIANNLVDVVDARFIGFGASDKAEAGFAMTERAKNLGAARMVAGEGEIQTVQGDEALAAETPDFIKVDVEGMEMQVLRGLTETIARARPVMLIEVDVANDAAFQDWLRDVDYEVIQTIKHYAENVNYFIRPA